MSNPAVITLAEVRTNIGNFQIEDNVGESIHFHIGEIRCDLTIDEFNRITNSIKLALQAFIKAKGFRVDEFSSEFLLQLAEKEWLTDLESVEEDTIQLNDILVDTQNVLGFQTLKPLPHSRVIKALNGNRIENNKRQQRNYFGETNQQRVDRILNLIKEKGYPFDEKKIVLYKNRQQIYDGQHRAACLFYLKGNKEIPILRLSFSNKKSELWP